MELTQWNPFKFTRHNGEREPSPTTSPDPLESSMLRRVERMFEDMERWTTDPLVRPLSLLGGEFGMLERWFGDHSPTRFRPVVDILDEEKELVVIVELPGLEKEDVEIILQAGALLLKGDKKLDKTLYQAGAYRTERAYGAFTRLIPLPTDVEAGSIDAVFKSGVLTVRVPKHTTTTESHRITIH